MIRIVITEKDINEYKKYSSNIKIYMIELEEEFNSHLYLSIKELNNMIHSESARMLADLTNIEEIAEYFDNKKYFKLTVENKIHDFNNKDDVVYYSTTKSIAVDFVDYVFDILKFEDINEYGVRLKRYESDPLFIKKSNSIIDEFI